VSDHRFGWLILVGALLALVLVPFLLFEGTSNAIAASLLETTRSRPVLALTIAALLAVDVLLPVPSSIVSTGAGTLLGFAWGTAASAVGMTAGCLVGYWVGRRLGRAGAIKVVGESELTRAESAVSSMRDVALLVCRPVPVLAEASVVAAGTLRIPFARFAVVVATANVAVSAWYASIGTTAVDRRTFVLAFLVAALLPGLALLGRRFLLRGSRESAPRR
jgi:uncharacterized membrane protein YdjX (TVP38/TMEM64 family)